MRVCANHLGNLLITLHTHSFKGNDSRDILSEEVVLQVKPLVLLDHSRARLLFIST